VLEIAEKYNYFKYKKQIKIKNKKNDSFNIAIICPEIISLHYSYIASELVAEFKKNGCRSIIYTSDFDNEILYESMVKCIDDPNTDAIICMNSCPWDFHDVQIPIITFGGDNKYSLVRYDIQNAMNSAISLFKSKGKTRISFAGENQTLSKEIMFLESMSRYKMTVDGCFWDRSRFEKAGEQAAKSLLQMKRLPEGVICAYDEIAYGLIETLLSAGVRVPEDIGVIGINDIPMSRYCFGGLTTVGFPFSDVCKELVADIIEDKHIGFVKRHEYLIPAKLIKRNTA